MSELEDFTELKIAIAVTCDPHLLWDPGIQPRCT